MKIYSFGDFQLSTGDRRLTRSSGEEVALTPRVFDLLLLLLESHGQLLTKNQILDSIWPDSMVEESNLSQNIFILRKALGETTQNPQFIRTVPTKGYRFIGEVTEADSEGPPVPNDDESAVEAARQPDVVPVENQLPAPTRGIGRWRFEIVCLVAGLFAVGAYSIGRMARVEDAVVHEVSYQQLTFERGTVWASRFLPGANAVIYNANFNNRGLDLYTLHLVAPEARPMGLAGANLLSISAKGELAILHNQTYVYQFIQRGTLATIPVGGSALRDLAENVQEADWSPPGDQLVIVRWTDTGNRLEYPIGRPLAETRGYFSWPRISPSGTRIAYFSHPFQKDNRGTVSVIGTDGRETTSSEEFAGLEGLAWHGDELWFTASKGGEMYGLYALAADGTVRTVVRSLSNLMLNDAAPDGSVLMSRAIQQTDVYLNTEGRSDADISWLQLIGVADMANDGSSFLFTHFGEGSGKNYSVYLRKTDGSPAIKLGEGRALALSPDGRFAAAKISEPEGLVLLPTGAGDTRQISIGALEHITAARWLPDGKQMIITANEQGKARRSFFIDLQNGSPPVPATPDGLYGTLVSPDGTTLLVTNDSGDKQMLTLASGKLAFLPGVDKNEEVVRWGDTPSSVYVYRPFDLPISIYRIDTRDGRREVVREIQPVNPAGVFGNIYVFTTADAKTTVYGLRRYLIDLYLVKGLQ